MLMCFYFCLDGAEKAFADAKGRTIYKSGRWLEIGLLLQRFVGNFRYHKAYKTKT
jgi:hypothetical protein